MVAFFWSLWVAKSCCSLENNQIGSSQYRTMLTSRLALQPTRTTSVKRIWKFVFENCINSSTGSSSSSGRIDGGFQHHKFNCRSITPAGNQVSSHLFSKIEALCEILEGPCNRHSEILLGLLHVSYRFLQRLYCQQATDSVSFVSWATKLHEAFS